MGGLPQAERHHPRAPLFHFIEPLFAGGFRRPGGYGEAGDQGQRDPWFHVRVLSVGVDSVAFDYATMAYFARSEARYSHNPSRAVAKPARLSSGWLATKKPPTPSVPSTKASGDQG